MSARDPLTLIERAKVAAAVDATVAVPGREFLDLCLAVDAARGIERTLDTARTEAQQFVADGKRRQAEADEIRANAEAILSRATATLGRARRTLAASIVFAGIGLGMLIAAVIL